MDFICKPLNPESFPTVLRILLNYQNEEPFVPSEYYREMKLSLEDRLEKLIKTRKDKTLPGPFLATPDMVIFQNFELGKWYQSTVSLKNKEQTSKCIKVLFEPTMHFQLYHPSKVLWTKIAPGMTFQVIVCFQADELKDYHHTLTFSTEEEQFVIPIYAFSPRALLDFPDLLSLPPVPIKMTSQKTLILTNHGLSKIAFSLIAIEPCLIKPNKIELKPSEKIFVDFFYKTKTKGLAQSVVLVQFEDGVRLQMQVECIGCNSDIVFDRQCISFEDTFIGLQRQIPLTIEYHGINSGFFQWKLYQDLEREQQEIEKLKEAFEQVRDCESLKYLQLKHMKIIDHEGHSRVYERICSDEIEEVEEKEQFVFKSNAFHIIPLQGEMGLKSFLEFTVIFTPSRAEKYEQYAYLEISGSEERIPLKLLGTGLGPQFKLNVAYLNANNIFLRSEHQYEIIVANTGLIPGSLTHLKRDLDFGGKIECEPKSLQINADHYAAFTISFIPGEEGKFIEKVEFVVNESNEIIHFIMTGEVIAPLLNIELTEINFGIVAFGYMKEQEIVLCNNSPVPIQFCVEVVNDGFEKPSTPQSFLQDKPIPINPQEFFFYPSKGVVAEESCVVGSLSLLPNVIRQVETTFVVRMWGKKNYMIQIPLKYDCRVADITCLPPVLDIKFCFINYEYERTITLKNRSNLRTHFKFTPLQDVGLKISQINFRTLSVQDGDGLTIEVTVAKNSIAPMGETKVWLKIKTPFLGVQKMPLYFDIFGIGPQILCEVICTGQGPAICFIPSNLNLGTITLLRKTTKEIEMLNDTPIPAIVHFSFTKGGNFSLKEWIKNIPPNSKQELEILVYLTDTGKQTDTLVANVENGQQMTVQLTAVGEGTSISTQPQVEPKLDLGTLLTYKKFAFPLVFQNEGCKWHKIWLSRSDDIKIARQSPNSSAGQASFFKMANHYFPLMAKESFENKILTSKKEQGMVGEHFYAHAVIEKSHSRHIILSFEVNAKFVDPYVEIDKTELNFYLYVSSDGVEAKLKDKIKFRNISGLALELDITIHPPFFIINNEEKAVNYLYLKLNNLSNRKIFVEFHPPPHEKKCITYHQTFYVYYRDHPKVETIPITGIINYPTLSITPQIVDFGCVPIGSSTYIPVTLKNISCLPVSFKWAFSNNIELTMYEKSEILVKNQEESTVAITEVEDEDENDCAIQEEVEKLLNSILSTIYDNMEETSFHSKNLPVSHSEEGFSAILSIVPHEGCLSPNEELVAYFRFTPQPDTKTSATALCHIVGGANIPVSLTGISKEISYKLKETHVHLGKIVFYEAGESVTPLINDGPGRFEFEISDAILDSGWLSIDPNQGELLPTETLSLSIRCYPGIIGRFETTIDIQIGYLDPVPVKISGFGTFPQIYLSLPRPKMVDIDPEISYPAIAELEDENLFCNCNNDYFPDIDKQILEKDDWVVILRTVEKHPCSMEIDMSIERLAAKARLEEDSELWNKLSVREKFWPIPNLVVTPYVFDLGLIQIDSKTLHQLDYMNYGPSKTVVKLYKNPSFRQQGFDAPVVRHMMEVHQTSELHISFHPTLKQYPELNTHVTETIFLDVRNGPRIPIELQVMVVTPSICVLQKEIDFGSIKCGECLRMSVKIINNGYLNCDWQAEIEENLKGKPKIRKSFFLLKNSGTLKPGEKFFLRVYFEPYHDDFISAELILTVEGNHRITTVELKGFGMEPFLEISEDKLVFDPCIPYSTNNDKFVTIRNVSKCTVLFYFADFDIKTMKEDALVRSYIANNLGNKIYIDHRTPEEELPVLFYEHYDDLCKKIELMVEKSKSSETASLFALSHITDSRFEECSQSEQVHLFKGHVIEAENLINNYVTKKIKRMSLNQMEIKAHSRLGLDNQTAAEYIDTSPKNPLIIFYGSPTSNYIGIARSTGMSMNLPVYTIDMLIADFLINDFSDTSKDLNNIINEALQDVADPSELETTIEEDGYDLLNKKIAILLEGRKKKHKPKKKGSSRSKKSSGKSSKKSKKSSSKSSKSKKTSKSSKQSSKTSSKSSKKSKKKRNKKKTPKWDSFYNISPFLLAHALEETIKKFPKGLIIESLNSIFIPNILLAFNCVVHVAQDERPTYLIIFINSFEDYLEYETKRAEEEKQESIKELDTMVVNLENMEEEDFLNMKESHPDIYQRYLKKRKDEVVNRRAQFSAKIIKKKEKRKSFKNLVKNSSSKIRKTGSERLSKISSKTKKNKLNSKSSKSTKSKVSTKSKKSKKSAKSKKSKKSSKSSKSKGSKKKKKIKLTKIQKAIKSDLEVFDEHFREILKLAESGDYNIHLPNQAKEIKQSNRSSVTVSEPGSKPQESISCWIINRALHNATIETLPNLLSETVTIKIENEREMNYQKDEDILKQSVLVKPKPRIIKKTDVFTIHNCTDQKSENHQIATKSDFGSKISLTNTKKKINKSLKSIKGSKVSLVKTEAQVQEIFTTRKLLQPGESIKYKFSFTPISTGNYRHIFEIGVTGWHSKFYINCVGSCDIPRLNMDPRVFFDKVVSSRTVQNKNLHHVFVKDSRTFEFGGILLPTATSACCFAEDVHFHLSNISKMICDVSFFIRNDKETFQMQQDSMLLEPKAQEDLILRAVPSEEELYESLLLISIKDNPCVEVIKLSCYGCEIGVDVNPKHVIFEKVTLDVALKKKIYITNNTPVEVNWYFVNYQEVANNFQISHFNGRMLPFSCQMATVYFRASEMQYQSSTMQAKVYDTKSRLVFTTDIRISAETEALEFFYQNELDFGQVKGWKTHDIRFKIATRGYTDIIIKIKNYIDENDSEGENFRKKFSIEATEGKMNSSTPFECKISFSPDGVMILERLPVFTCSLIDQFHQVVVREFEIFISAKVYLSKFELCPFPEIYFGYRTVGYERVQTFRLINRGRFEFTYNIKHEKKEEEHKKKKKKGKSKSSKSKSKSSKSSKSRKSKKSKKSSKGSKKSKKSKNTKSSKKSKRSKKTKSSKKSKRSKKSKKSSKKSKSTKDSAKKRKVMKPTTLKFGIFSLTSSTGIVYPNEEALIEIKAKPLDAGEHSERIIVHVSEPSQKDEQGRVLKVHLTACEPKVNFDDITHIFKEQYIVNKLDDALSQNVDAKVIFAKSEMIMKFNKVCVNTVETTRIRVQNVGKIAAHVTTKLSNGNSSFSVTPECFSIDPYQFENVVITFCPTSLEANHALLTLENRGYHTIEKLILEIIGEGCVPEVALIKPKSTEEVELNEVFPPVLVGNTLTKNIIFKNVGVIPCKVILEICFDEFDQLMLVPEEDTIPFLNLWDSNVPMNHTNLVNLDLHSEAHFLLKYEPTKRGSFKAELKIHTVNNPFETKTINISYEGYYMEVILEGLSVNTEDSTSLGYNLDFGYISLNTLEKQCFAIRNLSENAIYKFEFINYNEVIFSPAVGHIKPKSTKQILAVFLTRNPVQLEKMRLDLTIYQIIYSENQMSNLSWDDRQNLVVWCPEILISQVNLEIEGSERSCSTGVSEIAEKQLLKKIEQFPEPQLEIVPESSLKIPIFISVIAGYAFYQCEIQELTIPDTFIMNKQSVCFNVENTGNVCVHIGWLVSVKDFPRRINSCGDLKKIEEEETTKLIDFKKVPRMLTGKEKFLFGETSLKSSSTSTLFSSEALETNRSADSWTDTTTLPISVLPTKCKISPNTRQTFSVYFTPNDVFEYSFYIKSIIENKAPEMKEIEIEVSARSILPLYCFELEPSDYVENRRLGRKLCNDLFDENSKVVEFESVGLGIINTKKFFLKNPTKEDFFYSWQPAQPTNPHLSCFHCHTPHGAVNKGKTVEVVFSFISQECGVFEEFFLFNIPLRDIRVVFLLVGTAREPNIHFQQTHISLPPTIVGVNVTEDIVLKNEEHSGYKFKFGKMSMLSEGVSLHPTKGYLNPHQAITIKVSYCPKKKSSVNFDLSCAVEKIQKPLEVSVSCVCYEIQSQVVYTDQNGKPNRLEVDKINLINLGSMVPHQKYIVPFTITNIGKTNFQFRWITRIEKISGLFDIHIDIEEKILATKESCLVNLFIVPLIKCNMQPNKIFLKIPYGPCYTLQLNGTAGKPPFKLSFQEYDFGSCLLQVSSSKFYKSVLKFSNYNIWPITLEKGKHESHVSSDFQAAEVAPQNSQDVIIYFHPFILGEHKSEFPLFVDGKKMHINIIGKAVPLKLSYVNPTDKFIDFGSVLVGKTCTKTLKILNESQCPIILFFNFWERLPINLQKEEPDNSIEIPKEEPKPKSPNKNKKKKKKKSKSSKSSKSSKKKGNKGSKNSKSTKKKKSSKGSKKSQKSKSTKKKKSNKGSKKSKSSKSSKKHHNKEKKAKQEEIEKEIEPQKRALDYMSISPDKNVKLGPQKSAEFTITFSPKEKVEPFMEKIFYKVQNYIEGFCIVKGNTITANITLDINHLTFGNVVINHQSTKQAVLRNRGDIPLRFKWILDKKEENYSISPNKGHILPGTDIILDISFKPKTVKCWIKSKLICNIENINKQLKLLVSGSCTNIPPPKEIIQFSCPVREKTATFLNIENTSNRVWTIIPVIQGDDSFKTTDVLRIPARMQDKLDVIFAPMTLQDHIGLLCVPTPDGSITTYTLKGETLPPIPSLKITRDVMCKLQHIEKLQVKNWLLIQQQFVVSTTIEGASKKLFSLGGNQLIEVPPNSSRSYDWIITPMNEGVFDLKVYFTNKATKEYLLYEVTLNVLSNKQLEIIDFTTCVRKPITKLIKLENPLNVPIVYKLVCNKTNIEFEKAVSMEAHSVYYLEIIYNPTHQEDENKQFQAICEEMGEFCYTLKLTAQAPVPESTTLFKTYLGQVTTQKVEVVQTKNCRFSFENSLFYLDNVRGDNSLSVTFDPSEIGKFQGRLYLQSPTIGDFIYPLLGECCQPKPQGPFLVGFTEPTIIHFRNPFPQKTMFYLHVDRNFFILKQNNEEIEPKKIYKVQVSLQKKRPKEETLYPVTGKLTIRCDTPHISWVYYLQEDVE